MAVFFGFKPACVVLCFEYWLRDELRDIDAAERPR